MIIVEQENTYLVNFDNVSQITLAVDKEEKEYAVMAQTIDKEELVMGIYKTEERAKEVLQEIVNKYKQYNIDSNKAVTILPKVYEMPKE